MKHTEANKDTHQVGGGVTLKNFKKSVKNTLYHPGTALLSSSGGADQAAVVVWGNPWTIY